MAVFDEHQNVIMGAAGAGGYTIDQSIRFNDDDADYLEWTPGGAGTAIRRLVVSFSYEDPFRDSCVGSPGARPGPVSVRKGTCNQRARSA